jgi:hypothetical protein
MHPEGQPFFAVSGYEDRGNKQLAKFKRFEGVSVSTRARQH